MELYGSLTSPYVRKVRILLQEKALVCDFKVVNPFDADTPVPALNPLGKVPVLVTDDGQALFNSPLILEYLDSLKTPPLLPATGPERWQVLHWQSLADGIFDAAATRFLETKRPESEQSPAAMQRQAEKIDRALAYADEHLPEHNFLVDNQLSIADIALGVALDYVDLRYSRDWKITHKKLPSWQEKITRRPSFQSTTPTVQ